MKIFPHSTIEYHVEDQPASVEDCTFRAVVFRQNVYGWFGKHKVNQMTTLYERKYLGINEPKRFRNKAGYHFSEGVSKLFLRARRKVVEEIQTEEAARAFEAEVAKLQ